MKSSLSCVSALSSESSTISDQMTTACGMLSPYLGQEACAAVSAGDGSRGDWGRFSGCSASDQLSFVYDQYYQLIPGFNKRDACDFGGTALRVEPKASVSNINECPEYEDPSVPPRVSEGSPSVSGSKSGFAGMTIFLTLLVYLLD